MPSSNTAQIISDFIDASESWSLEDETEPELDLPPLPPPRPSQG